MERSSTPQKKQEQYTEGPWDGNELDTGWTAEQARLLARDLDRMYGEGNWQHDPQSGRVLVSPDHNNQEAIMAKKAAGYLDTDNTQREANRTHFEGYVNRHLQEIMETLGVWTEERRDSVRLKTGDEALGINSIMADVAMMTKHIDRGTPERSRRMKALDHSFNDVGLFALENPERSGDKAKTYFDARVIVVDDAGKLIRVGETITLEEVRRRGEERKEELVGLHDTDPKRFSLPVRITREKRDGSPPDYDTTSLVFDSRLKRYFLASEGLAEAA